MSCYTRIEEDISDPKKNIRMSLKTNNEHLNSANLLNYTDHRKYIRMKCHYD